MSTSSAIQISNFTKKYVNKTISIHRLEIKNRVTLFIGENGSGKSTVLKALMSIISFEGEVNHSNTLSFMPENPFFPRDITVEEFLFNLSQLNPNDYDYKPYLTKYGLNSKKTEDISSLSKGMKAKLNLIQCLIRNSDYYLLDEPLSGLDEGSVNILVNDIKKSSKSFIVSSHLEEAFDDLEKEVIRINELTESTL
ncbi:SkfA peptide export ATP-binding protein SkfE [Candidatus Izimaplasma bacterium HR1]|uniref:ATP-binding cassette domain-containing protein n=1 Tax=Candidatus Izimoplasma sp. HR1 TaxID=1541959 RepID=UPI0004F71C3B|nr:SkfA peptide export ATP-binding protein SkfE [Candidatus Izimaplasma bacterium HR1]